jgi:hypothetical protein
MPLLLRYNGKEIDMKTTKNSSYKFNAAFLQL